MGKLSDNKLAKLKALEPQGGFWYITKQNLNFRDLCFMAKILESWGDRKEESYQSFFDSHKEMKEFGSFPPLTAHRATKNCEYIGLIRPSNNYKAENLTPFYFALKDICDGDFNRLSSFPEIIDKQLERMFIDSNTSTVYNVKFQICPFMFLFKVLLLIGDITKSYKLSKSEFKLFVATAQSWMEYFEVVESILRYREDSAYRAQCDINAARVSDVRYNILAENHSQITVEGSEISIPESEIRNVRRKVAEYELSESIQSAEDIFNTDIINKSSLPLQQIFYGAPGTGKSHETNRVTREYRDTIRTTFHPDSDYSTFVGAYKPTTTKEPVLGLNGTTTVQLTDPSTRKPLETTKIVYKFIKQAFLKAYILAWKKMCNARVNTQIQPNSIQKPIILSHTNGNMQWEVTKIDDSSIYLTATEVYDKEKFKKDVELVWKTCWNNNTYQPNLTNQNRPQICVCNWMAELNNPDFEFCWTEFLAELSKGEMELNVAPKGDCKPYFFCIDSDNSIKLTRDVSGKKETVLKDMLQNDPSTNYQQAVANYLKEQYKSSTPNEAWDKLKDVVKGTTTSSTTLTDPLADIRQFLVIEEINRGNCAQIFGDLFQLLDRKNGFSEYPIEADEDITKALLDENPDDGLSFGKDGLTLPEQVKNELRRVFEGDANPDAIIEKICMGKVLALPSNLYIWATMNTSDQSLFPIDSAFKRRWDWEYVPIKEAKDKNYKIVLSGSNIEYDWWDFISAINNVINDVTSSEDKKLGYFFCKPCDDKNITANQFVNKVIFYLWNDVLKDYEMPKEFEYGETKKKEDSSKSNHMSFNDFYTDQEKCIRQLMENLGVKPIAEVVKTEPTTDDASTAATSEPATDDATASTATPATDSTTEQSLF